MASDKDIYRLIPHRPPFLWVDRIIDMGRDFIDTEKSIIPELEVFKGHYPHYPIMPGVLLCEAVFQSGALLLSHIAETGSTGPEIDDRTMVSMPVLTRISNAKFKREVKPGDTIRVRVDLVEQIGNAWFLKGRITVHKKTAVKVEFACTMVNTAS